MKRRVFYITHTELNKDKRFKITKLHKDYEESVSEDRIRDDLHRQWPKVDDRRNAYDPYVEIVGFKMVSGVHEKPDMDSWTAMQDTLFPPMMMKETVSYAPNFKGRKCA